MRDNNCQENELKKSLDSNYKFLKEDFEDIESLNEDILNGVQKYPAPNEKIILDTRNDIFQKIKKIINLKYSLGYPCDEIGDTYKDGISCVKEIGFEKIGYVNFIQFFSLGILLGVSKEDLMTLIDVADEERIDDLLLDYLISSIGLKRKIISSGYQKEIPYSELIDVVRISGSDKEKALIKFTEYTENNWIKGHSDFGWVNWHKEKGYYGLWSYEAGVVAKILKFDDSSLINSIHYPYDLVHYREDIMFVKYELQEENSEGDSKSSMNDCTITNYPELDEIIPNVFREYINQALTDYNSMSDEDFYKKYNLNSIWFTLEEYVNEKKNGILGFVIVNLLVEKRYILQLDYKEAKEDYLDEIKSYWQCEEKIVEFDLCNDQVYLAKIPEDTKLDKLFEVQIRALTQ